MRRASIRRAGPSPWCMECAAPGASTAWSPCASAPAWARPGFSRPSPERFPLSFFDPFHDNSRNNAPGERPPRKRQQAQRRRFMNLPVRPAVKTLALAIAMIAAPPALAFQFKFDNGINGSLDTTLSYGVSVRNQNRNKDLYGIANG